MQPNLQQLFGCFEDAARPAVIAGLEYYRCPRTLVEERELRVLGYFRDGYLESLTPMQRRGLPAKLRGALEHIAELAQAVPLAE